MKLLLLKLFEKIEIK